MGFRPALPRQQKRKRDDHIATGEKRSGSDEEQEKKTPKKVSFQRLSMGYKKDILAVFAYDFELSQFSVKYRLTPK